uniref:Translocation and assembly module TamB C-terminal domain-containing protein n=1 Tax=Desulfobacca acetoxidans TaxID=60893 RepID=A0A7C3V3C4_9BACT
MQLLRRILFAVTLALLLLVIAAWEVLHADFFWRWVGGKVVVLAQEECRCRVSVGQIEGNAFDGLFFNHIVFATPEGEVIRARSLEIQISFWSLFRLSPLISKMAILEPYLNIRQEKDGEWNIIKIVPPPPKQLPVNLVKIRFARILVIKGAGNLTQDALTQEFKNFDLEMDLDLENPVTPRQALRVGHALAAADTSLGRVSLAGRFTYTDNFIDLQHLEVKTDDNTLLAMEGKADLREGGLFQTTGKLDLPGQEIRQVWGKWPSAWAAAARFQAYGTRSHFNLTLRGKVQAVTLEVAGALGSEAETFHYDLEGRAQNLNPDILTLVDESLAKKLAERISPLDLRLQMRGTGLSFPPAEFSWSLETGAFRYASVRLDRFKLSLAGDHDSQKLQGSIKSTSGELTLDAAGSLFSGREGKFEVRVASFKPDLLGLAAPVGTVLNGRVDGSFSSPGLNALDRLKVSGSIEAKGRIGLHPLDDLRLSLAWSRNRVEVTRGEVRVGNLSAKLKGIMVGGTLDFSFQGKSDRGGNWPIPAAVGGQFSWEAALTGRLTDPRIALQVRGRGLVYEKFGFKTVSLEAQLSGWPPAKGRLDFRATGAQTPVGTFSRAELRADGAGSLWCYDLRAAGPEDIRIEVRGGVDLSRPSVTAERALVKLHDLTMQNLGPVEVVLAPDIEVKPVTFKVNQGKVALQARIADQQISGRLELQNLAAEWFVPKSLPLKGIISGQAALTGSAGQPVIQGNLRLEAGSYQQFEVHSLRTSFRYQDNRLSLEGGLQTQDRGPTLSWEGQVPARFSLKPLTLAAGQGEMQILVQGNNLNLSLLPSLVPDVESAQGPVNLQVRIAGTINEPRVSGQVAWGAGLLKLRFAGADYLVQPGEIRLQGNRLTLPQLTLASEGTVTLTGDVSLAGLKPEVKARLQVNNFKAIDKLGSKAYLDGGIKIDGHWPDLVVKGNLTIPQASFRLSYLNLGPTTVNKDVILVREQATEKKSPAPGPPKTKTGLESEAWKNLGIDLNIRAPHNVWIDDRLAKIEVAVDLQVRKRPGQELVYAGEINALKGHVTIVGREFQVTRGVITLPAQPGAEPMVNARVEYETNEVTLYAEAAGPVANPKITLGGEPAVSETDWMAYLLYGRPVAALSREEQGAVSAAGAFGGLATRMILKDLLGMAPPITRGLTISYQQRNDPLYRDDPYQVVIQYRINRRFSVQSQVGGRNTGGDVLFNLDF